MRLIDTKTLALKEFFGNQIPPYAILSHTWHEEEVSFQDWADQSSASQKKGYKKIFDVCQLAKKNGHDYVWVDTNCIDKSSSSELTEAINSMFKWYQSAQVCYVYLFDVPSPEAASKSSSESSSEDDGPRVTVHESEASSKVSGRRKPHLKGPGFSWYFRKSRWFTRGWTLQELLAPRDVVFYSNDWSLLGTKKSLRSDISSITQIDIQYLWKNAYIDSELGVTRIIQYAVPLRKSSVSERLSWLSNRTTTRLEDMAYCMLGIFELNMPLLYGEGSKAFTRLQEEIMKVSDDHSLFCWTWNTSQYLRPQYRGRGFLSEAPSDFRYAGRFVPKQEDKRPSPYTFTNAGLSIRLSILHGWKSSFIGILRVDSFETGKIFGLPMSGDLTTGRVCRMPFPFEPIPLCDGVSGSQEFSVFVSENYSQQHGYDYESSICSLISAKVEGTCVGKEAAVLLTFEPEGLVRGITTYPPNRFHPVQSSISIHVDEEEMGERVPGIRFNDLAHMYEAVFIHLELPKGKFKSFIIASQYGKFPKMEDRTATRWRWHYWRVSPEDTTTILSGELKESDAVVGRIHKAMRDPEYAQELNSQALESQTRQSHVEISIANDYLRIVNEDFVICHLHIAELS
jgi:hypothetical protein